MRGAVLALGLGTILAACSAGGSAEPLAQKDFGATWPFTVPEVGLRCGKDLAIFVEAGGKAYPLNGQAERRPDALGDKQPVAPLADIWRVDGEAAKMIPGARMSLDAVSRAAIAQCQRAGDWLKPGAVESL